MSSKHWTDAVADEIRQEVKTMGAEASRTFGEIRKPVPKPSAKDKLVAFLNLPRAERQRLFAEMGPDQYADFIQGNLEEASRLLGPRAAQDVMAYMYADGLQEDSQGDVNEATQFLSMLMEPGQVEEAATAEFLLNPEDEE